MSTSQGAKKRRSPPQSGPQHSRVEAGEGIEKAEKSPFVTVENVQRRQAIQLQNVTSAERAKRDDLNGPVVWFDTRNLDKATPDDSIFTRIINTQYSGVVVTLESFENLLPSIPPRMNVILALENSAEVAAFEASTNYKLFVEDHKRRLIVSHSDSQTVARLKQAGITTCFRCYVDDNKSLHSSIYDGVQSDYLSILFKDPTNIPLELVIASLQKTGTILMKEINRRDNVDDAIVTLGVMEFGAEGVVFSPTEQSVLDEFIGRLSARQHPDIQLEVGTVLATRPVGMGYRACIDTATIFDEDEGMIIGSTSHGGLLCCPEVYFLPYMELRPFRVNAGAVHSYVYNTEDRTDYMSELKAGSSVMLVNSKGRVRTAPVGRVKIEQRPLRLIEVQLDSGEQVNVLMQDDWHVRVFSDDAKPLNISELKAGDRLLAYGAECGRHVGIKINEKIIEK